jgi:archaellum biogenesis protein FlaJ (TadC family)
VETADACQRRFACVVERYLVPVSDPRSAAGSTSGDDARDDEEAPDERLNRELIELLNELRVALPGVQVLFAFLLIVPFSDRFQDLTGIQRAFYFATFVGTTVATGLFMAPTAYHRIRFREGDKERMLRTSNRFAVVGIGFLALSVTMAVVLTADLLFGLPTAAMIGLATFAFLVWVWFAIPVARKIRDEDGRG